MAKRKVSAAILAARSRWRYTGAERPDFADATGPGQESVWDYPRPPRCAPDPREVVIRAGDAELARTRGAIRVLETASPPTFYLPPGDVDTRLLAPIAGGSICEWKGQAAYRQVTVGPSAGQMVGWSYPDPYPEFESIRDYLGFYPSLLECTVDGAPVAPQPGRFYGGWITPELTGPFKGEPGSDGW